MGSSVFGKFRGSVSMRPSSRIELMVNFVDDFVRVEVITAAACERERERLTQPAIVWEGLKV